jgi:pSer/pThr/pTyr-binding forkhead associated (FHA) protein
MTTASTRAAGRGADGLPAACGTRLDAAALLRRAAAAGPAQAGAHLVVQEPGAGERIVALRRACTVGRGRAASVQLDDPSASRVHLRLQVDEAGATVEDLGSRNGLRVNGGRWRGVRRLRSGDRLQVGETLLRYVDPLESPTDGAPASAPARSVLRPATLLATATALLAAAALASWL